MVNERNWTEIHKDFAEIDWIVGKTYQQIWEEKDLTYQDAQEWMSVKLEPNDYEWISLAKSNKRTSQQFTIKFSEKRGAQEWLDFFYSPEKRKEITMLDINGFKKISDEKLSGLLNLSGFVSLEELNCSFNDLNNLIVSDCPKLRKIVCWGNKLTNLNISNQLELIELNCSKNSLITLIVTNNPNLITLWCFDCQITDLRLINNLNLERLDCYNNQLTDSSFLNSLNEKLTYLDVKHNQLSDLIAFSHLSNCEELILDANPLSGSLSHLGNLKKLKKLWITNTQLDSDLECLPDNLEEFWCEGTKLEEELKPYNGNFPAWKLDQEKQALESDLNLTEHRIAVLQSLIKEQKAKIVEAYKAFAPEKELLQELITAHLEYCKAKNQKRDNVIRLRRQRDKFRDELEERLEKQLGGQYALEVEHMLTDCEGLIHWMTELDEQLTKRQKLLEDQKQFLKLTDGNEAKIVELETKIKENEKTNQNQTQALEKQLANFEGQLFMLARRPQQIFNTDISGWINNDSNIGSVGDNSTGTVATESASQFQTHIFNK